MDKNTYAISTIAYGIIGILSMMLSIYFIFRKDYLLSVILSLMFLVCLDNFFCSDRMCRVGYTAAGHWSLPPFFKK